MERNSSMSFSRLLQKIKTGRDYYGDYSTHLIRCALGMIFILLIDALIWYFYTFEKGMMPILILGILFAFFAVKFALVIHHASKAVAREIEMERQADIENENLQNITRTVWSESYLCLVRLFRFCTCTVAPPNEDESAMPVEAQPESIELAERSFLLRDGHKHPFTRI